MECEKSSQASKQASKQTIKVYVQSVFTDSLWMLVSHWPAETDDTIFNERSLTRSINYAA